VSHTETSTVADDEATVAGARLKSRSRNSNASSEFSYPSAVVDTTRFARRVAASARESPADPLAARQTSRLTIHESFSATPEAAASSGAGVFGTGDTPGNVPVRGARRLLSTSALARHVQLQQQQQHQQQQQQQQQQPAQFVEGRLSETTTRQDSSRGTSDAWLFDEPLVPESVVAEYLERGAAAGPGRAGGMGETAWSRSSDAYDSSRSGQPRRRKRRMLAGPLFPVSGRVSSQDAVRRDVSAATVDWAARGAALVEHSDSPTPSVSADGTCYGACAKFSESGRRSFFGKSHSACQRLPKDFNERDVARTLIECRWTMRALSLFEYLCGWKEAPIPGGRALQVVLCVTLWSGFSVRPHCVLVASPLRHPEPRSVLGDRCSTSSKTSGITRRVRCGTT